MKTMRRHLTLAALVLGVACALAAPKRIKNFDVSGTYKSAAAVYQCDDDTVFTASRVLFQWPTKFGDNNIKALQDSLISQVFGVRGENIDKAMTEYVTRPWRYGDSQLTEIDPESLPADAVLLEKNVSVYEMGFNENVIVFKADYFTYGGGAHPNYYSHFLNYDVKNNKILYFNDIFENETEADLLRLIKQWLLAKYYAVDMDELESDSGIFSDEIVVSRDIYISGEDVVFHYNPYSIAPWSVGSISVPIPFSELEPYFTPSAKALLIR
ncbi:MAG: DUF3298 domain-containing protein [Muribaculaceae bacterium]|nr:DUF3298 domain-containing protein [Muribaculaceae bacterium]